MLACVKCEKSKVNATEVDGGDQSWGQAIRDQEELDLRGLHLILQRKFQLFLQKCNAAQFAPYGVCTMSQRTSRLNRGVLQHAQNHEVYR